MEVKKIRKFSREFDSRGRVAFLLLVGLTIACKLWTGPAELLTVDSRGRCRRFPDFGAELASCYSVGFLYSTLVRRIKRILV